ncbi:hypothetical protein BJI69_09620 [Luteibacter rhizovicinus DSM 16549]|uniref:Integral membrane bound transporter domain-containing protein n=1 Tax=Luteibacter rhizovicinus DSM 16549 TaxID=1440763 RepID=A0A1L3EZM3_9GAMM|nr:hypothetical protein BJI69_09620 [Luteibacter rhizovicinus DSM 16549]
MLRLIRLGQAQAALDRLARDMPLHRRMGQGLMMAVKVLAASLLSYAIGRALHTEQAFWAAITAIAVTQPHFGDTRGAARDRCLGTAIGAVAGLLGLWIGGPGEIFSFSLALGLVTLACWTAGAGPAARLGGITATIVLLVPSQGPSWEIAFYRLGEVALGTLCAIAVGWLASFIETRVMRDPEKTPDAQA